MPTPPAPTSDPSVELSVFWYRHRRELAIGFVVLLLAAAAWGALRLYLSQRDEKAAAELASANSADDYEKIISQFGNTPAGASATLLLAGKQHADSKFPESNKTLQDFIDKNPKHELVPVAKIAMASNLQSLKKSDEALSLYQQIAATYPHSYTAPLALISQLPLLKEKHQPDQARRACETIVSQYPQSFWSGEAMRELRSLKPAAMASPSASTAAAIPPAGQSPAAAKAVPSPK